MLLKKSSIYIYIFLLCGFLLSCKNNKQKKGEIIVDLIYNYKRDKGQLPGSLFDLGVDEIEEGPIYYSRQDTDQFIVWYGTDLGESNVYNSNSMKWEK